MDQVLCNLRKVIDSHSKTHEIASMVSRVYPHGSREFTAIMSTVELVSKTHKGGKRNNGQLLLSHELAMFAIAFEYCEIRDLQLLYAILLHDLNEDYPEEWSIMQISAWYGHEVARLVSAVTKPPKEDWQTNAMYDNVVFARVNEGGKMAILLKIIDRLHNMLTLWGDNKKKTRKVRQTIVHVLPMAASCDFLLRELMAATNAQLVLLPD